LGVFASSSQLIGPVTLTFGLDGNLYVAGEISGNVTRFDGQTGVFIDTFIPNGPSGVPSGSGGVNPPLDLRFGPDNNLYVASRDTNQVLRYDGVTGAFLGVAASGGGLNAPVAETFGPDGHLYVSSFQTNQVLRYDGTTGAFIDVFSSGGGLAQPNNLAFGPDGNLYMTGEGSGVQRYDGTTGAFIDTFAPLGGWGVATTRRACLLRSSERPTGV
jgi:streptogramin lyase